MKKTVLIALILAVFPACGIFGQIPRVAAPQAVIQSERHVVSVFAGATCADPSAAKNRGNGFFVADQIIATAAHFLDKTVTVDSDFAVVDYKRKCHNAQVAKVVDKANAKLDVMFLKITSHHGPGIPLADKPPEPGEKVYSFCFESSPFASTKPIDETMPFSRNVSCVYVPKKMYPPYEGSEFFAAVPMARLGDSGSALINKRGEVVGMVLAIVINNKLNERYSIYVTGAVIKKLFLQYFGGKNG
jgi:S1-C subfamily serine protease